MTFVNDLGAGPRNYNLLRLVMSACRAVLHAVLSGSVNISSLRSRTALREETEQMSSLDVMASQWEGVLAK